MRSTSTPSPKAPEAPERPEHHAGLGIDAPRGGEALRRNPATHRDCWAWAGWEPDRFYRRLGSNPTFYFGNGPWIREWRMRLQRRETLHQLQEMGVTVLITRFFKGFGKKAEEKEWKETAAFVQQAKHLGIKVWGYLQGGSLFGETLFPEQPDARRWVAKTAEGKDLTWGNSYFRFMPCLNNPAYQKYFLEVLEAGIRQVGLEGIHIDNNYYRGCYCESCCALFRRWLNERHDLEPHLGLPVADGVMPPPLQSPDSLVTDPLRILWIAYNVETRARFYGRVYRHLKALNPEAGLCANPAFPRDLSSRRNLSLDPSGESDLCDFLFAENGNQPGWQRKLLSQAESYLLAEAGGYRTLSTSWRHRSEAWQQGLPASNPPRTSGAVWAGLAEEFSYHSALLGNNWMTRPAGERDRMLMDSMPEQMEAFRQGMAFFRHLEARAALPPRRTWGEYGLLLNPTALSLCGQTTGEVSRAVLRYLQLRRLPFRILFSAAEAPNEMRHLIVCHQLCLPDRELSALKAFAQGHGRSVTLLGQAGRYNEWFIRRDEETWRAFLSHPGIRHGDLPLPAPGGSVKSHFATGRTRVDAALKAMLDAMLRDRQRRVTGPHQLLINIEVGADGSHYLHLRDQSESLQLIRGARVYIGDLCPAGTVLSLFRFHDGPEHDRIENDGRGWLALPDFRKYCLVTTSQASPLTHWNHQP